MYFLLILKFIAPNHNFRAYVDKALVKTANGWIRSNNLWMKLTQDTIWDVKNKENLDLNDWYFITCNHQSWTDILVLHKIFLGKIPFIRFFIKRELLFLPVLGLAWWAYDFPIMSRHSKKQILKNPSLKTKDLLTTKKACEKYKHYPVTILNFLEGTRFTHKKHKLQKSPYECLLRPKLGGFSYAIYAMDKKISHLLDVTIIYPNGRPTFWQFLCGKVKKINVYIEKTEIPEIFLNWTDLDDDNIRTQFRDWVCDIWMKKNQLIKESMRNT